MSCGVRNEGETNMTMLAVYYTTNSVSDDDDGAKCPADVLFEGILRRLTSLVIMQNAAKKTLPSSPYYFRAHL